MRTLIPGGFLVAIEGIDGSGKTTQAALLAEECWRLQLAHVVSKEPTSGVYGRQLRESAKTGRLTLEEELYLFMRDRRAHVELFIQPALDAGKVVILDRYYFSSAAHQGSRGADPEEILAENEAFAPEPDLLILLDVPCQVGLSRIRRRGDNPNTFGREDMLTQARNIFLSISRPYLRRFDASENFAAVSKFVLQTFLHRVRAKIGAQRPFREAFSQTPQLFEAESLAVPA